MGDVHCFPVDLWFEMSDGKLTYVDIVNKVPDEAIVVLRHAFGDVLDLTEE